MNTNVESNDQDADFDFTSLGGSAQLNTGGGAKSNTANAVNAPAVPAKSKFYNAAVAQKLFELGGSREKMDEGGFFFEEHDKPSKGGLFSKAVANKMYFIAAGEVSLTINGKALDTLGAGEIFGEMSVITGAPRSASAAAKTKCAAYSLDAEQFQHAIQKMPEFALMLMNVMFDRLRLVAARLASRSVAPGRGGERGATIFEAGMLKQLDQELEAAARLRYQSMQTIMREREAGAYMYVVLEGRVTISIKGSVVETLGVGGTFGEMALVDQSPRTATAVAETEVALLAINRATLLALIKERPLFAMALLKAVAERLRYMNSLLA